MENKCYHCKETVGKESGWLYVNGEKKYFHLSVLRSCMNDYLTQQNAEIEKAKRKTILHVVSQHGGEF